MPKQQLRRPGTGANAAAVTQDATEAWRRCFPRAKNQPTRSPNSKPINHLSEANSEFTLENQRLEDEV